jgi:hypothetical protein
VKMCHIDKLWPKEYHAVHTKGFACRPYTHKDDHFIHRAEEVWQALFGNRERNKGLLNYGLVAMVYAELKLEHKVDWSTYPTTTPFPLCIGKTTKDIPDMYTPEFAATKGILAFLKKKPEGTTEQGSSNTKGAKRKATYVHETSNPVPREQDPRVQNPPANGAIPTVVQGSTVIVEKHELEVGTKSPIAVLDAVIEKLISVDPSPPTVPATLSNPVHTTDAVATDAINIQPRVEVVHNVGHDDTVPKPAGTLQDLGPSVAAPSIPHSPIGVPPNHVGVGLDVMEMLRNMPNSETLKELLEFSTTFAIMCRDSGERRGAPPFAEDLLPEDFLRVLESSKGGQREVTKYAYNLRNIAQLLATATPGLLEAAMGFDKFVGFINPLLHEMAKTSNKLNYTFAELDKVRSKCERLESSLQTYIEREEENGQKHLSRMQSLQKKLEETKQHKGPSREADKSMTQESLATSDKLSLPLDALWKGKEKLTSLGEGSNGPNTRNLGEAACGEPQSNPATVEDAAVVEQGATLESVVQKLEVANKERDKALADLEAL